MSHRANTIVVFCLVAALLTGISIYSYKRTNESRHATDWVRHSHTVISLAETGLEQVREAETLELRYVITADQKYLDRYNNRVKKIDTVYSQLIDMVKDNPSQAILLDSLHHAVKLKIAFADSVIALRKSKGLDAARQFTQSDIGGSLMLSVAKLTSAFNNNEEILLSERLSKDRDSFASLILTTIFGRVVMLIILFLIFYFYLKEHNKRLNSEKDLIEAKKSAEESAMLKETFLANMSHEIRTPMNSIIGFTNLLLKHDLQPQEKDYVRTIKSSGESLLQIVNDVLDISKINSGAMVFEEQPISIKEVFRSMQIMLSQKAAEKKLDLSFNYDANLPDTVLGDATRLSQILINLVGNAIKFTKQGSVSVYARLITEEEELYRIEILVKDTGIGITEDNLQHIFERFRQAEAHTTRNYGGTGLGLSISKQLTELQGGTISVKSKVGEGSVFSFVLPYKKTSKIYSPVYPLDNENNITKLGNIAILLVEDNPANIKFVSSLFAEYHIHADVAENGRKAIEKIKTKQYDIILMDIEMPEMNGYETTSVIRNDLKSGVSIIAMTANAMAGEREKCLQAGMDEYIAKPINAELLFEKMVHAVSLKVNNSNGTSHANTLINLGFLTRSMHNKKEVIKETIDIVIKQIPLDAVSINDAVQGADYSKIKTSSHHMKSTVSLIGITALEKILEEMENLSASATGIEKIRTLNNSLALLTEQAITEIQEAQKNYI